MGGRQWRKRRTAKTSENDNSVRVVVLVLVDVVPALVLVAPVADRVASFDSVPVPFDPVLPPLPAAVTTAAAAGAAVLILRN